MQLDYANSNTTRDSPQAYPERGGGSLHRKQCDQIGRFLEVLGNKSSPKLIAEFWAVLKKINLCKNCRGFYLGNFGEYLGNFLNQASGHIVRKRFFSFSIVFNTALLNEEQGFITKVLSELTTSKLVNHHINLFSVIVIFLKMGHSRPIYSLFLSFQYS